MGLFSFFRKRKTAADSVGLNINIDKLYKITKLKDDNEEYPFDFGNIYERERNRVKIGVSHDQVDLLLKLVDELEPPYFLLYVLVVSRLNNQLGRYQSPALDSKQELQDFLIEFKEYLETDGRHQLWIGTTSNSGQLVYDKHNLLFAYGPIEKYRFVLDQLGFKEQAFSIDFPHYHNYHEENDKFEEAILDFYNWKFFPLQDNDFD